MMISVSFIPRATVKLALRHRSIFSWTSHPSISTKQLLCIVPSAFGQVPRRESSSVNYGPAYITIDEDSANEQALKDTEDYRHPQDFVNIRLEPGEWDYYHRDPLHRPKWRKDAKVKMISPEDFENRPPVTFGEEFKSLHDCMGVFSWIDHSTYDSIYERYCQLMLTMSERNPGTLSSTSHEYVMRVLGQEFHMTASRAAGIVQLRHNEEQIRKTNPELISDDCAEYVDETVKENIALLYGNMNEVHPEGFVEPPTLNPQTGVSTKRFQLDDLYDQDELWEQMVLREAKDARMIIDNHIYVEDVDDTDIPVKLTAVSRKLMKAKTELELERDELEAKEKVKDSAIPKPLPESGREPRRQRAQFVAFLTNTRDLKKLTPGERRRRLRQPPVYQDILVEQHGKVRAVTLGEVKKTSVYPKKTQKDKRYAGVKQAWLDRVNKQTKGVWGPQEAPTRSISNKPEEEAPTND